MMVAFADLLKIEHSVSHPSKLLIKANDVDRFLDALAIVEINILSKKRVENHE